MISARRVTGAQPRPCASGNAGRIEASWDKREGIGRPRFVPGFENRFGPRRAPCAEQVGAEPVGREIGIEPVGLSCGNFGPGDAIGPESGGGCVNRC